MRLLILLQDFQFIYIGVLSYLSQMTHLPTKMFAFGCNEQLGLPCHSLGLLPTALVLPAYLPTQLIAG